MRSPWVAAGPAVLYAILMLPRLAEHVPTLLRPDLNTIANLLGSPLGATIGWTHFLAFDLFIGRWIYLDSRQRGIRVWLMAPILFFTLLLGPCGFLLHLVLRHILTRADLASDSTITY